MSNLVIHNMDLAWASSAPAVLAAAADDQNFVEGVSSTRLSSQPGCLNAFVEFVPTTPLNLSGYGEIRFWLRSNRRAEGTTSEPFYLEFSFVDSADSPGETHRWLVPINQDGVWELRRIGIENERRTAIVRFRFTCVNDLSFVCHLDELLAVSEDMVADAEAALVTQLDRQIALPEATNILLGQSTAVADTQVVLPLNRHFAVGNLILLRQGATSEVHTISGITHNEGAGTSTITLRPGDEIRTVMNAGVGSASILVPLIPWIPPAAPPTTTPAIFITLTDAREDLERTGCQTQRDSFRLRGNQTVCSVRPAARAYILTYQITFVAPERPQYLLICNQLLQRLSANVPLRINGYPSPVWILPPPAPSANAGPIGAGLQIRVATRMEVSPRHESRWVRSLDLSAAPIGNASDQEGIVINL